MIERAGDAGVVFDIALVNKINKALGRKFNNPQTLQKRYEVLKRQNFTGKLIPDEQPPKPGDKDVVMIPAKIHKKMQTPQTETFTDPDRLLVHMHNLEAEHVAVVKEIASSLALIAQTERNRLEVEINRCDIQKEQLAVQREQLTIQNAMFIIATQKEKKQP